MPVRPYLLFLLRGHPFAVRGEDVREVTRLPALAPIAEVPPHVAGLLDLRGALVPVIDLAVRMGYDPTPLHVGQAVVVLAARDALTGLVVDAVEALEEIDEDAIEPAPQAPAGVVPSPDPVVRRVARVGGRVATLLDAEEAIFRVRPEDLTRPGGDLAERLALASPEDLEVMRERARRLAQPMEDVEEIEAPPLVLVRIGGEDFAVPAEHALEFVRLDDLAPVPCCPGHVAGHASLRGDVIVVVDLRDLLGLDEPRPREDLRAMLVRSPRGPPFAILVDEVLDVAEARGLEGVPDAARASRYVRGSVLSEGRRVPVLDVARVAEAPELIVKEDA